MSTRRASGQLRVNQFTIVYKALDGDSWEIPVSDIRVLGEYTNNHGPAVDDYFFVFVTRKQVFEASFYADGRDQCLAELGRRIGHNLQPGLCSSTTFMSRILWPAHLEGHSVFSIVPEDPAAGILGKLRQRILPKIQTYLSEEVQIELQL